jgi:hypothetical protein
MCKTVINAGISMFIIIIKDSGKGQSILPLPLIVAVAWQQLRPGSKPEPSGRSTVSHPVPRARTRFWCG